jgi:hypothetical protein
MTRTSRKTQVTCFAPSPELVLWREFGRPNQNPGLATHSHKMYRLTSGLLLALLFAGIFVPVATAISSPSPHACCVRKPMHDHGSSHDIAAVEGHQRSCCPPVTTAHWAEVASVNTSNIHPQLAYLPPGVHPALQSIHATVLKPVRGPPLS